MLETTCQRYLRQASLQAANDRISNAIAALPIFPHCSFDLDTLYGAVDGQQFGVDQPAVKARSSRKYFGRGKVAAYTLLCNDVPINGNLIGAHAYEAHLVFDIWYRNTSDIVPMLEQHLSRRRRVRHSPIPRASGRDSSPTRPQPCGYLFDPDLQRDGRAVCVVRCLASAG